MPKGKAPSTERTSPPPPLPIRKEKRTDLHRRNFNALARVVTTGLTPQPSEEWARLQDGVLTALPSWFPVAKDGQLPERTVDLSMTDCDAADYRGDLDKVSLHASLSCVPWELRESPSILSILYDATNVPLERRYVAPVYMHSPMQQERFIQVLCGNVKPLVNSLHELHSLKIEYQKARTRLPPAIRLLPLAYACIFGSRPLIQLILKGIENEGLPLKKLRRFFVHRTVLHYLAMYDDEDRAIDILNTIRQSLAPSANARVREYMMWMVREDDDECELADFVVVADRIGRGTPIAIAECLGHKKTAAALKEWKFLRRDGSRKPQLSQTLLPSVNPPNTCDCAIGTENPIECEYHKILKKQTDEERRRRRRRVLGSATLENMASSATAAQVVERLNQASEHNACRSHSKHVRDVLADTVDMLADPIKPVVWEALVELLGEQNDVLSLHAMMDAGVVPPTVSPRCGEIIFELLQDSDSRVRDLFPLKIANNSTATAGLFDIYDEEQPNPLGGEWVHSSWSTFEKAYAVYFNDHCDQTKCDLGSSLPVIGREDFHKNFASFSRGLFDGFDWRDTVVVGGSVFASLTAPPGSQPDYFDEKYDGADIDVYFTASQDAIGDRVQELFANAVRNLEQQGIKSKQDVFVVVGPHTVTLVPGYPYRPIQVIASAWMHVSHIVMTTDLDVSGAGFDGRTVWMTRRGFLAYRHRWNTVDLTKYEIRGVGGYERRLAKYATRGFKVVDIECRRDQMEKITSKLLENGLTNNKTKLNGAALLTKLHLVGAADNDGADGADGADDDVSDGDRESDSEDGGVMSGCGNVEFPWFEMETEDLQLALEQVAEDMNDRLRDDDDDDAMMYGYGAGQGMFTVHKFKDFGLHDVPIIASVDDDLFPTKPWLRFLEATPSKPSE